MAAKTPRTAQSAWLRSKGNASEMVLMGIFGDSMEPELKEGGRVLIVRSQRDVLAGVLFAVGIDDDIVPLVSASRI